MKIEDYKFIIAFDLATFTTGYSVFDIENKSFVEFGKVQIKNSSNSKQKELFDELNKIFDKYISELFNTPESYYDGETKRILILKEALPMQFGKFTTIQTIKSLAKSHSILDLICQQKTMVDIFNEDGIFPVSVRASFSTKENRYPQKEDVLKKINNFYGLTLDEKNLDITDSMALTYALFDRLWNNSKKEKIKDIRKHIKTLKAPHVIKKCEDEIKILESEMI